MENILIRREYPANKPKKEGVYFVDNEPMCFAPKDISYYHTGKEKFVALINPNVEDDLVQYFYEPLTIDGAEELIEKTIKNIFEELDILAPDRVDYGWCEDRDNENHLHNAYWATEKGEKEFEDDVENYNTYTHSLRKILTEFSASRVEEKPLDFKQFNANNFIKVKLTEKGWHRWLEHEREWTEKIPIPEMVTSMEKLKSKMDDAGYVKFQFYVFVSIFGEIGTDVPSVGYDMGYDPNFLIEL